MAKHLLNWKNISCKYAGKKSSLPFLKEIDRYYMGTLLSRILDMKKQTPISLKAAIHLLVDHEDAAYAAGRKGTEPGHLCWYAPHFVEWISELGYHIELTGDEFEPFSITDKVA